MVDIPNPVGGSKFRPYIKAIIEAERAPIRQIETRKSKDADKLKLLQEFTGKVRKIGDQLKELDNFRKFRELKADFGKNEDLIGLEIDKNIAEPGDYQLEIVQLAGRHSMMSNGFSSADEEVGVGFFSYETAEGETQSVYLSPGENTLAGLAKVINNEHQMNLQAMVVNDGTGSEDAWHLIVAGKKTGMNSDLVYPEFYFVDGDRQFRMESERAAQSAIVKLNGFEILADKNKLSDLIPGVTLDLKQAKEGYEFGLSIKEDVAKISGKAKGLIDSLNTVLEFINKQNQLDERTDTTRTLGGDGTLRTIESQIRELVLSAFPATTPDGQSTTMRASEVGITFERTGLLSFNQEKFQKKITDNFEQVSELFTGDNGLSARLRFITNGLVGVSGGILVERERGFRDKTKQLDEQITRKEQQISRKEESLKRQFASLESYINSMQGQQQFVASSMASIPQAQQ